MFLIPEPSANLFFRSLTFALESWVFLLLILEQWHAFCVVTFRNGWFQVASADSVTNCK